MAQKIDQLEINGTAYDISLPPDAGYLKNTSDTFTGTLDLQGSATVQWFGGDTEISLSSGLFNISADPNEVSGINFGFGDYASNNNAMFAKTGVLSLQVNAIGGNSYIGYGKHTLDICSNDNTGYENVCQVDFDSYIWGYTAEAFLDFRFGDNQRMRINGHNIVTSNNIKKYRHFITIIMSSMCIGFAMYTNSSAQILSWATLKSYMINNKRYLASGFHYFNSISTCVYAVYYSSVATSYLGVISSTMTSSPQQKDAMILMTTSGITIYDVVDEEYLYMDTVQ